LLLNIALTDYKNGTCYKHAFIFYKIRHDTLHSTINRMGIDNIQKKEKVKWQFVVLFYVIAFTISGLFNSGFLTTYYKSLTEGYFISDYPYLPACIGTLSATIFVLFIDRSHKRTITFFGNFKLKNLVISVTPLIAFTITGIDNNYGQNSHIFAFCFTLINLIYAVFEEIGWRGYLQDALRPLKQWYRFLIIGLIWWAWHFRFHTTFELTIFPLICIGGSFLIGQFTEKTKSYLTAGGLHCLIILLSNSGELTREKMIAGGLAILIWLGIGKFWNTETVIQKE
jgi:uncharacterized protein